MHAVDSGEVALELGEPRARLASGSPAKEGESGRFAPDVDTAEELSTLTSSSGCCVSPFRHLQGSVVLLRKTIIAPRVPAHFFRVSIFETQDPQIKASYSEIRGGGSPEEEASDTASSLSSPFAGVSDCSGWGVGSLEIGRSRRLQHDS